LIDGSGGSWLGSQSDHWPSSLSISSSIWSFESPFSITIGSGSLRELFDDEWCPFVNCGRTVDGGGGGGGSLRTDVVLIEGGDFDRRGLKNRKYFF